MKSNQGSLLKKIIMGGALLLLGGWILLQLFDSGRIFDLLNVRVPDLRVEKVTNANDLPYIRINNIGQRSIAIQRVYINGKEVIECSFSKFPQMLQMGKFLAVIYFCPGEIFEAIIYTDHGSGTYTWK